MSRVIVTGHQGYLGHFVVGQLLAAGHQVTGIDTGLYNRCSLPGFSTNTDGLETLELDIRDIGPEQLEGADHCVHLAGLSNDPLGDLDPSLTYEINHAASVRLAENCRTAGVKRFVAASSCSVYGASDDTILDEESPFAPVTPYADSKRMLERDIAPMNQTGFTTAFLRGGTVYGLSPRIRFDLVVNNLVAWASATGRVLMKSDGSAWRPFVHVQDFASAFCRMLEAPAHAIGGEAFNVVAPGESLQIRDVAECIASEMPSASIEYAGTDNRDARSYRVSGKKLEQLLGKNWNRFSLADGIRELATGLPPEVLEPDIFESSRFQRLSHLQARMAAGELTASLRQVQEDGD